MNEMVFFADNELPALSLRLRKQEESGIFAHLKKRNVYIYGAGKMGRGTHSFLIAALGMQGKIVGFLDSDLSKVGQTIFGLSVLRPDDPSIAARHPVVVIALGQPQHVLEVEERCDSLGYEHVDIAELRLLLMQSMTVQSLENNADAVAAMDIWFDEESRHVYRSRARLMVTADPGDAVYTDFEEEYFPPFISPSRYANFVDGGAYDGDTLARYLKRFASVAEQYYLFEPDTRNYQKLLSNIQGMKKVHAYQVALHDSPAFLRFHEHPDAFSSSLGEDGEVAVAADALDCVLQGKKVDFIKLDVEGSELQALQGACGIIAEQRPALAICVYHQPEHLWQIPLWIKAKCPEYRLALRHYSRMQYSTVCYAF